MEDQWLTGSAPKAPVGEGADPGRRSRTPMALKLGLLGAGVVAGAVVAGTMTAGAATPSTGTPSSEASAAGYGPGYGGGFGWSAGRGGEHKQLTSGTVKAVGAASVTVTVDGADKTYAVNSDTRYVKNGPATLADVKVGDTVHFATSSDGQTITFLADGKGPAGGPGRMFRNVAEGTVKAVGAASVTVTVDGADKTYAVTSDTKIVKNGAAAKLADVKVGDTVHFATSSDGKTITFLADGKPPVGAGGHGGFGRGPGGYGFGGGFGGYGRPS